MDVCNKSLTDLVFWYMSRPGHQLSGHVSMPCRRAHQYSTDHVVPSLTGHAPRYRRIIPTLVAVNLGNQAALGSGLTCNMLLYPCIKVNDRPFSKHPTLAACHLYLACLLSRPGHKNTFSFYVTFLFTHQVCYAPTTLP